MDWTPSSSNRILDEIDAGLEDGQQYSIAGSATKRAAWRVIQKHCPAKEEGQCRAIIATWAKNELLRVADYEDPVDRKPRSGVRVDPTKRPS
jgi:hypothetical protein